VYALGSAKYSYSALRAHCASHPLRAFSSARRPS
jgi:hypothetical protein